MYNKKNFLDRLDLIAEKAIALLALVTSRHKLPYK